MKKNNIKIITISIAFLTLFSCTPNSPYRSEDKGKSIYYTTFDEAPKYLDPARSYYAAEYEFLAQIYEPLIQYHYLKRPYELIPLTAESVPSPVYYDSKGAKLPSSVSPEKVKRVEYDIAIKKGIMYQPHPAFAKDSKGDYLYRNLKEDDLKNIVQIIDFPLTGTRELLVDDYIYQIKRLADPRLQCPIFPIIAKYVDGMAEFSEAIKKELESIRAERKKTAGAAYNQESDEKLNPIKIDYDKFPLPGVVKKDDYNFTIILKNKYPQFAYWLAMSFFAPMPKEATDFYAQGVLADKNININRFPVGTGPYRIDNYKDNMEITMVKNENFHGETYPSEGEIGDKEKGLLKDAGKALPLIEKLVFKMEKENIPRWNKFLQGYYDASGISSDSFDQAITTTSEGMSDVSPLMKEKGISLNKSVSATTYYLGFNMIDNVVGGYDEKKQKLRQAISIAFDFEEFIEVFSNGRGLAAQGVLPPGIYGFKKDKEGINPYVYDWDEKSGKAKRKSIEEAKKLLSEAGYPDGRDKDGKPLIINFDNAWTGADSVQTINWLKKRTKLIGIQLESRTTDPNRFFEKLSKGDMQVYFLGWNADYPDPENFFFLLYGPNSRVKTHGENTSNYDNKEFNKLFKEMENMDNSPERMAIIDKMNDILRKDSPWIWAYHPLSFSLAHNWVGNRKSNAMANNTIKYISINPEVRDELRYKWNRPVVWPFILTIVIFALALRPAIKGLKERF